MITILATVPDDTPTDEKKVAWGVPSFGDGSQGIADPNAPVDELQHGSDRFPWIAMLLDLAVENDP